MSDNPATPQPGQVIAHLGKSLAVEGSDGNVLTCHTLRQLGSVAVGDRVLWEACGDGQGRVIKILPRSNVLTRPAHGGKTRPVAANLHQVLVVLAPVPTPDFLLVDQIFAICESRDIGLGLVFNKLDLFDGAAEVETALCEYAAIGYPVYRISVHGRIGTDALQSALQGKVSMLSGQSGVGKSSISRMLLSEHNIRIGEVSSASGLGRHTTTTATLYHLAGGGDLIDSPGVAIFGLADMNAGLLAQGYREFQPYIARCRFNDCLHTRDHGCAVVGAVQQNLISAERYQRYVKLLERLPSR
ncbi:MAG: ribosome small subunit-dependent GTPase A [Methylococcaceae bacterium]|nr:MAG: ribosome small subunit-dependent GTPase A [Methylococcaceae bacterium]